MNETRDDPPVGPDDETRIDRSEEETIGAQPDLRTSAPREVAGYTVHGVLGEGGMGVVLDAEQQNPRRRVALKMLHGGAFASQHARGMFQREIETLALLQHPNIASIYESGTGDDGLPFIAMELVEGRTLDRYVGDLRPVLDRDELAFRLRLFRKLCSAVHYAHQRGVIHRDLKPDNVIVSAELTDGDGIAELKVLDFGLARLVETDQARTAMTRAGAVKGTLAYMSPEQARGDQSEIDTRTDVYALGVILYELLTGQRPHAFDAGSFIDAVRTISDRPVRPLRDVWPSKVVRLDDDLDTIVHTALRKEKERRYSGADALAQDIERYLGHQPIQARPPSTGYQLRKFARRNRALVGGILATVVVSVLGAIVATVFGLRAARARDNLEQVVTFQADMLGGIEAEQTGLRLLAAVRRQLEKQDPAGAGELADQLARRINPADLARTVLDENILQPAAETVAREFGDQPLTEARLHDTLAKIYAGLGMFAQAERELADAVELRTKTIGANDPTTLATSSQIGLMKMQQGQLDEALAWLDRVIAEQVDTVGDAAQGTLRTRWIRGSVLAGKGDYPQALEAFTAILEQQRSTLGDDHEDTLETVNGVAAIHYRQGRYEEAARLYELVLAERRRTVETARDDPAALGDHASSMMNLGAVRMRLREYEVAEALLDGALAVRIRVYGEDDPRTLRSMNNLGLLYSRMGRHEASLELGSRTLEIRRRLLGAHHDDTLRSMNNVAVGLTRLGRYDEAAAMLDQLLALDEKLHPETQPHALHLHTYAELHLARQDWSAARAKLDSAIRIYRRIGDGNLGLALVQGAGIEAQLGRTAAALNRLEEAVELGYTRGIDASNAQLAALNGHPRFAELLALIAESNDG